MPLYNRGVELDARSPLTALTTSKHQRQLVREFCDCLPAAAHRKTVHVWQAEAAVVQVLILANAACRHSCGHEN